MKEYEKLDKAIAEAERTKRQIKYYEDKVKILEHKIPKLTRKERTHRLCTRGAMLEKYLQEPDLLTDEEVQEFLTRIFSLSGVERTLEVFLDMARERILEERYMDQMGYGFLIMVKGMKNFIREIILENMGSFENKRSRYNDRFDVYGTTIERRLFDGEEQKRFIHIFYSDGRAYGEKQEIKQRGKRLKAYLNQCVGRECESFGPEIQKYFYLHYENDGRTPKLAEENTKAIEEELSLAGYFAIVSSDRMTAKEAIERYKSRDASEKLFRADQSYLGNRSMRVGSDAALSTKIFIQFLALILRCRVYTDLKDKCEAMGKRPNDMTVPATLKELEKIVMIRHLDGIYRLDHAITKPQKTILDSFRLTEANVRYQAQEIGKILQETEEAR